MRKTKNKIPLIFALVLVGSMAGVVRADLLYYYGFEEGTGTTAGSSVNQSTDSDLTLTGATSWGTGITGSALSIDGVSGVAGYRL